MNIRQRFAVALVVGLFALCFPQWSEGGALTLAWDPPIDGVTTGYNIYYGSASAFYSQQIDVGFTTRYTISGLPDGITYFFAVRAYDNAGNLSDFSNEVYATTSPSAPSLVTSLALVSDVPSPQTVGATISWLATAAGGLTPYEFQWAVHDGTSWAVLAWTPSSTWNWTPGSAGDYSVRVAVRSSGSTSTEGELSQSVPFMVNGVAPPPVVTTLTLTSNVPSPQDLGTTVTWVAAATGGVAPYEYQWSVLLAGTWTAWPWTTSSTWLWTPTTLGDYQVRVAVRSSGNTSGEGELTETTPFSVTAPNCFFKSSGKCVHLP